MHSHRRHLGAVALVALLMSGGALAQLIPACPSASADGDVFASLHVHLNDAADRALADGLAEQPWMKASRSGAAADGPSARVGMDQVRRVRAAVERVGQLRPTIEPILREEGVPAELSAVVLVESGGLVTAISPKGARGFWQFMPDTARRYGLEVSDSRDERLDVRKSTRAAARYLRNLYQKFGDWQLAFAAYNAGEQTVARALGGEGLRNFSGIEQRLPEETRRYVPAVLAAMHRLHGHEFHAPARVIYAPGGPGK